MIKIGNPFAGGLKHSTRSASLNVNDLLDKKYFDAIKRPRRGMRLGLFGYWNVCASWVSTSTRSTNSSPSTINCWAPSNL